MLSVTAKIDLKPKRVTSRAAKARRRNMIAQGAFVRREARSSLRKRKRISRPGKPPSVHLASRSSVKNILFAYDRKTLTTVVGPVAFSNGTGAPRALEHGGKSKVRKRRGRPKRKRIRVRPRPFMGPALAEASKDFWKVWKGSV